MTGVLPQIKIALCANKTLRLDLPSSFADLQGEPVDKRLDQLAQLFGRTPELRLV